MKKIHKILPAIFLLYLFTSCNTPSSSLELLQQAQEQVQSNPAVALSILDSINDPSKMGTDDYMKYIVVFVQAKYETTRDISNDSIILQAQSYFNKNDDSQNAMLANLYAGNFYYSKDKFDKSLESFLLTKKYAKELNNNLCLAKSNHSIGSMYFRQDLMDSAITNYKRAITYYNKVENVDKYKLDVITSIGRSYRVLENLDSAYHYFDKGYKLAQSINDQTYQGLEKNNLGYILFKKKEYTQAATYLYQSLTYPINTEDSICVYLNLSELYNQTNQLDSSRYYTDRVTGKLSSIKDNYILAKAYRLLSEYHSRIGNDKEALKYSQLEGKAIAQIEKENSAVQLVSAEKKYSQHLHQQEMEKKEMRNYFIFGLLITIIVILLLIGYTKNKSDRQKRKLIEHEKKLLETNNKLLESEKKVLGIDKELLQERVDVYLFIQNIYEDVFNEWTKLEKEIKEVIENIPDEDTYVFSKLRVWMDNLSSIANLRFIFAAKDFLRREHNGEKLLKVLADEDLLLFMLLYNEYSDDEIETIMGDFLKEKELTSRKEELVAQLYKAELDNKLIKKFDK